MDLTTLLSETLSLRAFDSLWFWLILGLCWTQATARVLGVPWDLVLRGRQSGPEGAHELDGLVHLYAHRAVALSERTGVWMLAVASFAFSIFGIAGFLYGSQVAQALFLLAVPLSLVVPLNLATAQVIIGRGLQGDALWDALRRHRLILHALAGVSIALTALWGTWQVVQAYLPVI